jgi:hypothetical protein
VAAIACGNYFLVALRSREQGPQAYGASGALHTIGITRW